MEMNIEERKKLRDKVLGEIDLPIFRAKKIDSNEYIQGSFINHYYDTVNLTRYQNVIFINNIQFFEIDIKTLAISLPRMLDKNGKKIFASLDSKDGIGGDIINCYLSSNQDKPNRTNQVVKYYKPFFLGLKSYDIDSYYSLEIIGIK